MGVLGRHLLSDYLPPGRIPGLRAPGTAASHREKVSHPQNSYSGGRSHIIKGQINTQLVKGKCHKGTM